MVSVKLEDCRHKLGPNGVFIVQGLGDDNDDGDDDDGRDGSDYIPESKLLDLLQLCLDQFMVCGQLFSKNSAKIPIVNLSIIKFLACCCAFHHEF